MSGSCTNAPVFLVGPVRSGSTFLRLMLNEHPDITNPGECDFLFDRVGDDGALPDIEAYLHWLAMDRIFAGKQLSVDERLGYLDLMRSFIDQFCRHDAVLVMNVHRHFHRIPHVFPDAKYIHLLRDPRDVARSCIGMGWVGHVYYGVDIWQEAELSWDKLRVSLDRQQYLEVRYEELLENVESGLVRICEFLGLQYAEQMMGYATKTSYAPPDKSLCYQWKRKFSQRELQLVEGKVGDLLVARGYELSGYPPVQPGLIEKLRLAIENKRFRVLHQAKRYGWRLYLENLVASRLGGERWRESCIRQKNNIDIKHLK